jgi:UDP:flavonoid glycosyltransferase YjiC (YdhE family)
VARVLLAWEFGGDLGHARRAVATARQLRELGHETAFAFPDLASIAPGDAAVFASYPSPRLATPEAPDPAPLNAPDILLNLGYADAAGLAGALRAWQSLVRLVRPSLLLCDYAPTALLAARAAGLPRLTLGSGFSVPPAGKPMPSLRPWAAIDPALLMQRDMRLMASVREAWKLAACNGAPPETAAEVFAADAHLACTWPELDPFGARGDVEYLGPQPDTSAAQAQAWRGEARPRVFAYLKPRDPRFAKIVEAIVKVAGEAIVAAPGLDPRQPPPSAADNVRIVGAPVALDVLARADLCVNPGGIGVLSAALRHGVAQALLPMHLEQYLVARRAVEGGFARALEPDTDADFATWLRDALADRALREAALAAQPLGRRAPASAGERIARALAR